ncbi:hypothetical protein [Klebsiella oxytoca]|nr:hypothetical protein [Klebsiella oxytoca]
MKTLCIPRNGDSVVLKFNQSERSELALHGYAPLVIFNLPDIG